MQLNTFSMFCFVNIEQSILQMPFITVFKKKSIRKYLVNSDCKVQTTEIGNKKLLLFLKHGRLDYPLTSVLQDCKRPVKH